MQNMNGLVKTPMFGFASRMKAKRIYVEKSSVVLPKTLGELPLTFPGSSNKPKNLKIKTLNTRARFA